MVAIETHDVNINLGIFSLNDVSVAIPKGKMTAIVGPNGSGKSTLLKIISHLLEADFGDVLIKDQLLIDYKRKELAKIITMMPQSKESLPNLTVRELVSFGRTPYKKLFSYLDVDEHEEVIEWALHMTNTKKYEDRLFQSMSGGEQQKVRIAMALAQKTDILLLDEPTTFLDIAHQLELMELLKKINETKNITIVMVLHELQQAAKYCHEIIAMKKGEVAVTGAPNTVFTEEFFKNVYEIKAKIRFDDDYPIVIPISTI